MTILGLGSNIGDRLGYLKEAVRLLAVVLKDIRASRILESQALLPPGAPADWNHPYLNMAIAGETALSPEELFAQVKNIERRIGRKPGTSWCPREIDIDILAMDDVVLDMPELSIPHRQLLNRDFALLPLIDVAPDWRYPAAGEFFQKTATEIAAAKDYTLGKDLRDTGLGLYG